MQDRLSGNRKGIIGQRASHGVGFWLVAYSFATVMAFSALPTPLYVLYAAKDGFSPFMITLVFAAYAVGVIASLLLAGHLSDWYGRRTILLPAIAISALAGLVFIAWTNLPALFAGRLLSGLAVGMVSTTATAHLGELHQRRGPGASGGRPQLVAVAANLGGIGAGPLVGGLLAQFAPRPLLVPYLVLEALLILAVLALAATPETSSGPTRQVRYRPQRLAVPREARSRFALSALSGFVVFAVFGLFTSLAPGFLSGTLHEPSHALAGAVAFSVFAAAAIVQIALRALDARRNLTIGVVVTTIGLGLLAGGTWATDLAMFVSGGVLTGAGAGLVFKGALVTTIDLSPARSRAEVLAGFFVASYVGLALPVVLLGVIGQLLSAQVEIAGFAAAAVVLLVVTVGRLLVADRRRLDASDPQPSVRCRTHTAGITEHERHLQPVRAGVRHDRDSP